MDQDTRSALASFYEQLGKIAEQAFEARAAAVGLEKAISENSQSMAKAFQLHVHSPTATEIKLRDFGHWLLNSLRRTRRMELCWQADLLQTCWGR